MIKYLSAVVVSTVAWACPILDVELENVMSEQALTGAVVVAHDPSASLFTVGQECPEPTRDYVDEEDVDLFDGFLAAGDDLICGSVKVATDTVLGAPTTARLTTTNKASCNCNSMVISVVSSLKEKCNQPNDPYDPANCRGPNDAFVGLRNHALTSTTAETMVEIGVFDTGYSQNQPLPYDEDSGEGAVTPHRGVPEATGTFQTMHAARVHFKPVAQQSNNINWLWLWLFGSRHHHH